MDKRSFIKNLGIGALALHPSISLIENINKKYGSLDANSLTENEDYWAEIRKGYLLKPEYINLENGYYNFVPTSTLNHFIDHIKEVNYQGSHYMRTVQWENKDKAASRLADLMGCGHDELIITRNTTESLDTVISGYDWKSGDEAVMAEQDYGSMLNQFKLMAERYGIVNKLVSVPNHPKTDDEIVSVYEKAITNKTRLLMVCHMVNITGQILPIRKICDMAHSKGVDVMVDGAHAFAQFDFSVKDLDCDYYGASLHKWLSTPLGAGILYVKKEKISGIWPIFAAWNNEKDNIKKLNQTGTHPVHTDITINDSIDYYLAMGREKKENRLRYLQRYWTDKVREVKGVIINTPVDINRSCAIANVGIEGLKPADLAKTLLDEFKIWTVAIDGANVHGCRITPNVYTSTKELNVFVDALTVLAKRK
jgi:selenocysteine lyase/cysteine desulfurase